MNPFLILPSRVNSYFQMTSTMNKQGKKIPKTNHKSLQEKQSTKQEETEKKKAEQDPAGRTEKKAEQDQQVKKGGGGGGGEVTWKQRRGY